MEISELPDWWKKTGLGESIYNFNRMHRVDPSPLEELADQIDGMMSDCDLCDMGYAVGYTLDGLVDIDEFVDGHLDKVPDLVREVFQRMLEKDEVSYGKIKSSDQALRSFMEAVEDNKESTRKMADQWFADKMARFGPSYFEQSG